MLTPKCRIAYQFIIVRLTLATSVSPLLAAPTDPFTSASQSFDAAPPMATNYNVGDWGGARERGAATYTFPVVVPPGRNGMAPSLALRFKCRFGLSDQFRPNAPGYA